MRDAQGKTIRVGDSIAIAQRQGSAIWQSVYKVLEVTPTSLTYQGARGKHKTISSRAIVVVAPNEPEPEEPQASCFDCGSPTGTCDNCG